MNDVETDLGRCSDSGCDVCSMRDRARLTTYLHGYAECRVSNRHGVIEHYRDGRLVSVGRKLDRGVALPAPGSIASRRANLASDVHPAARGTTSSVRLKPQRGSDETRHRVGGLVVRIGPFLYRAARTYADGIREYYRGESLYA